MKEFGWDWSKSGSLLQLVPARSRCCGVLCPHTVYIEVSSYVVAEGNGG